MCVCVCGRVSRVWNLPTFNPVTLVNYIARLYNKTTQSPCNTTASQKMNNYFIAYAVRFQLEIYDPSQT